MPDTTETAKSKHPEPSISPRSSESSERLLAARIAFDHGDFLATQRTLEVLLRANPPEPLRAEAEELKQRVSSDKVSWYLAGACLLLFASVALTYLR